MSRTDVEKLSRSVKINKNLTTDDIRIFLTDKKYYTATQFLSGVYVLGIKGSGKSYIFGKINEQLDLIPVYWVDPIGDNKNVAEEMEDKFYIDTGEFTAEELYELFREGKISIYTGGYPGFEKNVLDFMNLAANDLNAPRFAKALMIDELQYIVERKETITSGEEKTVEVDGKQILDRLVQTGRSRGWGPILASQRPVRVAVGAREQISTWIIMRQSGADLDWIRQYILPGTAKERKQIAAIIAGLELGEFITVGNKMEITGREGEN
jgi:DNA helicase HerA-like ATPase